MEKQYEYYLRGKVQGPVGEAALADMLKSGELGAMLRVRSVGEDAWTHADALFHIGAEDVRPRREASSEEASDVAEGAVENATLDARGRVETNVAELHLSPEEDAQRWFYKIYGHEVGPVDKERLVKRVELGLLESDMHVRQGALGPWRQIGGVDFLQDALRRAPEPQPRPEKGVKIRVPSSRRRIMLIAIAGLVALFMLAGNWIVNNRERGGQSPQSGNSASVGKDRVWLSSPVYRVSFPQSFESSSGDEEINGADYKYARGDLKTEKSVYYALHAVTGDDGGAALSENRDALERALLARDDAYVRATAISTDETQIDGRVRIQVTYRDGDTKYRQDIVFLENGFVQLYQSGSQIDDVFFASLTFE